MHVQKGTSQESLSEYCKALTDPVEWRGGLQESHVQGRIKTRAVFTVQCTSHVGKKWGGAGHTHSGVPKVNRQLHYSCVGGGAVVTT